MPCRCFLCMQFYEELNSRFYKVSSPSLTTIFKFSIGWLFDALLWEENDLGPKRCHLMTSTMQAAFHFMFQYNLRSIRLTVAQNSYFWKKNLLLQTSKFKVILPYISQLFFASQTRVIFTKALLILYYFIEQKSTVMKFIIDLMCFKLKAFKNLTYRSALNPSLYFSLWILLL